jgi:hypothetical protein
MAERLVVHSVVPDAEAYTEIARRLREGGVEIVEQQPHMLLVSSDRQTVDRALGNVRGWSVSALTTVPPPRTRERVLKRP